MRGSKGCFICEGDHLANTRYRREELTTAINELNIKNPEAILTVEDVAYVIDLMNTDA